MEEAPLHSHPQALLEPCSLYTTRLNSQRSVILPEGFPLLDERLKNSISIASIEPHSIFPPETSVHCPTISVNGSVMPPDCTTAHNFSSFRQNNVSSQNNNPLPVSNDLQYVDGDSCEEDDHEEIRVLTDKTEYVDGGRSIETFGGVQCTDSGMGIGLDNEGKANIYSAEGMVDHQILELDNMVDNDVEGIDVNLDDCLDNGYGFHAGVR